MESGKVMILLQLVNLLGDNFQGFEKAYSESNKENFEKNLAAIKDIQKKINVLLKTV